MDDETVKTIDFRAFTSSQSEDERSSFRRQVVTDCLDGKIVILKNVDLGINFSDFDMAETFPSSLAKLGIVPVQRAADAKPPENLPLRLVLPRPENPESPFVGTDDLVEVCKRSFGGDWARFGSFLGSCDHAVSSLRGFVRTILKDHQYYNDAPVLRFGLPENTAIHLDPTPMESKEALRVFVNVDNQPRVWRHSVNIYDFVEDEYHNLDLQRFFRLHTSDRLSKLSKVVTRSPRFQEWPSTTFEIAPKDVWVFDARTIGHQVVAGRRAVSLTAKMRNEALPDYHVRPKDRLFSIHQRKERAALALLPQVA